MTHLDRAGHEHKDVIMDDALLASIKARCDAARPGPWTAFVEGRDFLGGSTMIRIGEGDDEDLHLLGYDEPVPTEDWDFIAHARQDIPALIAEIERLKCQSL